MTSDHREIENCPGSFPCADATSFRVWAPYATAVSVETLSGKERLHAGLERCEGDYFEARVKGVGHNDLYRYILDAAHLADPASRSQPYGVHGPSRVIDHTLFEWTDHEWKGTPFDEYVIYELHVGTFTREGTFQAASERLDYLRHLGITAVELMPVAQFPGERNWGYDGVFPFAPQNTFGGPDGLKIFVDACHRRNISVILDVVYNHVGPEGNYLGKYGPYFTEKYRTPWGDAINFDGPYSDHVRSFFTESALAWITDYHIDALRVDAVHGIFDFSARTFLEDLVQAVKERGRRLGRASYLIAESDLNDVRLITPQKKGGIGFDAQWNDDFHHALHTILTGESNGYYCDFGSIGDLAEAFRSGYVYTGQYSRYRQKRHGTSSRHVPADRFVVFSQNHDQVGNRHSGDRLASLVSAAKLRISAVITILSPFIPLLFMGEEYGETAPFHYFVDHTDEALVNAVRNGRAAEFSCFEWEGNIPDPQKPETFLRSRISGDGSEALRDLYRRLIGFRHSVRCWEMKTLRPALRTFSRGNVLSILMPLLACDIACIINFSDCSQSLRRPLLPAGVWTRIIDTESLEWGGQGETAPPEMAVPSSGGYPPPFQIAPFSAAVYRRED